MPWASLPLVTARMTIPRPGVRAVPLKCGERTLVTSGWTAARVVGRRGALIVGAAGVVLSTVTTTAGLRALTSPTALTWATWYT